MAPSRFRVASVAGIPAALDALGLRRHRPVLVLVGGAKGLSAAHEDRLSTVLREAVLPLLDEHGGAVVDGGTDSGVMRIVGRAHAASEARFPLVGVAAAGTVVLGDGAATSPDATGPEPHHTHLVLVPGTRWGDESAWLAEVAGVLAGAARSVTLVVNGGEITYDDVAQSLARGRPALVLAGTGRTADAIAEARRGRASDPRAVRIAASALTHVVAADDDDGIAAAVRTALGRTG